MLDVLVSPDQALDAALPKATAIAESAPLAVRALKRALRESDGLPIAAANEAIRRHRVPLDDTADYVEGLAAFAEKLRPRFTGRQIVLTTSLIRVRPLTSVRADDGEGRIPAIWQRS